MKWSMYICILFLLFQTGCSTNPEYSVVEKNGYYRIKKDSEVMQELKWDKPESAYHMCNLLNRVQIKRKD